MLIKGLRVATPLKGVLRGERFSLAYGEKKDIPEELASLWLSRGDAETLCEVIQDKALQKEVKTLREESKLTDQIIFDLEQEIALQKVLLEVEKAKVSELEAKVTAQAKPRRRMESEEIL